MPSVLDHNELQDLAEVTGNAPTSQTRKVLEEALRKKMLLKLALIKQRAPKELYIFNKFVMEAEKGDDAFVPLAPFHKELCDFVTDRADKKKLILIPRSHLKTKLITVGYPLFRIAQNPKVRGLIYSATWQMAVDIHSAIQKQLQSNQMFINLFGNLSQDATIWAQDRTKLRINDKREPTITAAGIDNNLVGGHYDFIIMDDVVNRDNINTMDQILKVNNRYKDSLDLLEPHGQLILIGTRWHDSDLYGWILDPSNNIASGYDIMIKQAFQGDITTGTDFQALWPDKFSLEALRSRLREEGWAHFSAQYMNNPVPEEDAVFKRTWFKYYDEFQVRGKILNKFLAIDPALTTEKESDYTAMVVVGIDEFGYIYILDIVRAKLSPNQILNEVFRLRERWRLYDIGIETVAFQKTLAYSLRDDPRFKMHPFHVTELKPQERSKEQRIKALQPLYENGKILHSQVLPNLVYLEDELTRFPRAKNDDLIDALSYVLDFVFPAKQPGKSKRHHKYLY